MAKSSYIIKTTSGDEREYTLEELIPMMEYHLKHNLSRRIVTREDCIKEIDGFVSRYKLVDN